MSTHDRYFSILFRQTHKAIKTQTLSSVKVKAKGFEVVAID